MDASHLPAYAETLIRGRRAIRAFRSDPVPEETLHSVFALAGSAPSSSNTQPWEVEVVSGEARNRLSQDLLAAHAKKRRSPDFLLSNDLYTGIYQDRRRASGAAMYQVLGIDRDDPEARGAFEAENLKFYGAPHVALLFMPPTAEERICADVGIYAQTLLLALAAYGIGSCPQGILGLYADTIRESLGIMNRKILFGISFGYGDAAAPLNNVPASRAKTSDTTRFHS